MDHEIYELQKDASGNWTLGGSNIHVGSQVIEIYEFPDGSRSYLQAVVDRLGEGPLFLTYAHIASVSGPYLKVGLKLEWDPAYIG